MSKRLTADPRYDVLVPKERPVSSRLLNSSYFQLAPSRWATDSSELAGLTAQDALLRAADRC